LRTAAAIRAASGLLAVGLALAASACGGGGTAKNELIVLDRSIGGVRLDELRAEVERREGRGKVVSSTDQEKPPAHLEQVAYRDGDLVVGYVSSSGRRPRVIGVETRSKAFHTSSGVRVGAKLQDVRALGGIRCQALPGSCYHGLRRSGAPGTGFLFDQTYEVVLIGIISDAG
jgi:hypothetical protein